MTNFSEIAVTDEQLPPPDASWKEILEETDWSLLREQKEILEEIKNKFSKKARSEPRYVETIEGILSLLDHIQDAAANDIGEEKIFHYEDIRFPKGNSQ